MDNKVFIAGALVLIFISLFAYFAIVNKKLIESGKYDELNKKALKDKKSWTRKGFKKIKKI